MHIRPWKGVKMPRGFCTFDALFWLTFKKYLKHGEFRNMYVISYQGYKA